MAQTLGPALVDFVTTLAGHGFDTWGGSHDKAVEVLSKLLTKVEGEEVGRQRQSAGRPKARPPWITAGVDAAEAEREAEREAARSARSELEAARAEAVREAAGAW